MAANISSSWFSYKFSTAEESAGLLVGTHQVQVIVKDADGNTAIENYYVDVSL